MKESENKPDKGYWYYAKEKLEKEEEELARLPDTPMPEGWQPDGWKSKL